MATDAWHSLSRLASHNNGSGNKAGDSSDDDNTPTAVLQRPRTPPLPPSLLATHANANANAKVDHSLASQQQSPFASASSLLSSFKSSSLSLSSPHSSPSSFSPSLSHGTSLSQGTALPDTPASSFSSLPVTPTPKRTSIPPRTFDIDEYLSSHPATPTRSLSTPQKTRNLTTPQKLFPTASATASPTTSAASVYRSPSSLHYNKLNSFQQSPSSAGSPSSIPPSTRSPSAMSPSAMSPTRRASGQPVTGPMAISKLHERCALRGIRPIFDIYAVPGSPMGFGGTIQVASQTDELDSSFSTKKEAKAALAQLGLDLLQTGPRPKPSATPDAKATSSYRSHARVPASGPASAGQPLSSGEKRKAQSPAAGDDRKLSNGAVAASAPSVAINWIGRLLEYFQSLPAQQRGQVTFKEYVLPKSRFAATVQTPSRTEVFGSATTAYSTKKAARVAAARLAVEHLVRTGAMNGFEGCVGVKKPRGEGALPKSTEKATLASPSTLSSTLSSSNAPTATFEPSKVQTAASKVASQNPLETSTGTAKELAETANDTLFANNTTANPKPPLLDKINQGHDPVTGKPSTAPGEAAALAQALGLPAPQYHIRPTTSEPHALLMPNAQSSFFDCDATIVLPAPSTPGVPGWQVAGACLAAATRDAEIVSPLLKAMVRLSDVSDGVDAVDDTTTALTHSATAATPSTSESANASARAIPGTTIVGTIIEVRAVFSRQKARELCARKLVAVLQAELDCRET